MCFLYFLGVCVKDLIFGYHIYVVVEYVLCRGDRAFCSVECRCRQIFMDEEESLRKDHCSLAAMKPTSSTSSSASSSTARHHGKGARNRAGGFAY